jgi:ubiquinone/menaquinone biosynthesis C-methylase UbiE
MKALSISFQAMLWALVCVCGCAQGAAGSAGAPRPASPAEAAAATSSASEVEVEAQAAAVEPEPVEGSVHPGINDPYFRPNALDRYTRILEAESREIVQRREDIVDAIGLKMGDAVGDIGAGTGLLTFEMAEAVGKRGRVYAVDIVPEFLERIRKRVDAQGLSNVSVVLGEAQGTGLAVATLDVAFMCDTYHHLEYPVAYMRSVFETLRPGSRLVLVDMIRVEGESSPSVLKHVRTGKAGVIEEVERAGFRFESEIDLLEENYYLYFRRP